MRDKLTISWDEINSPSVEQRLREREILMRTREHYENPSEPVLGADVRRRTSIWYNTVFYMAFFGLVGGLLGWGLGAIMHFRPNAALEARELIAAYQEIERFAAEMHVGEQAERSLAELRRTGRDNPYFAVYVDESLSQDQKDQRLAAIEQRDAFKDFLANVLFFGVSGMMIAICLGVAEPVVDRNVHGAVVNGSLAAAVGMAGGIFVSLFVDHLHLMIAGGIGPDVSVARQMLARAITWGVLGLFLSAAPGLIMQNRKKLLIGMGGGMIGGVIGGLLFDPIAQAVENQHVSRLIAIVAIGLVAGLSTGMLENAVKTGWFKVTEGLIAGKQFVLYRNPTYIGSSPQSHIYLFKDPRVGRRHAAVHIIPGGYELEDLPLGEKTLVNGKPVTRTRLRSGDRIQIGRTAFHFHEKEKKG